MTKLPLHFSSTVLTACLLFAGACTEKKLSQPERPSVPEIFKTQLMKFLEEGAKISAMSGQGLSYTDLRSQLAGLKANYDLVRTTWPSGLTNGMTRDFDRAIRAWDLSLSLWTLKVGNADEPTEPNINGFLKYQQSEFSNHMVFPKRSESDIVPAYRGKLYVPLDSNITVLLSVAHLSFNDGRDKILKVLQ